MTFLLSSPFLITQHKQGCKNFHYFHFCFQHCFPQEPEFHKYILKFNLFPRTSKLSGYWSLAPHWLFYTTAADNLTTTLRSSILLSHNDLVLCRVIDATVRANRNKPFCFRPLSPFLSIIFFQCKFLGV